MRIRETISAFTFVFLEWKEGRIGNIVMGWETPKSGRQTDTVANLARDLMSNPGQKQGSQKHDGHILDTLEARENVPNLGKGG